MSNALWPRLVRHKSRLSTTFLVECELFDFLPNKTNKVFEKEKKRFVAVNFFSNLLVPFVFFTLKCASPSKPRSPTRASRPATYSENILTFPNSYGLPDLYVHVYSAPMSNFFLPSFRSSFKTGRFFLNFLNFHFRSR
jgi:hypothetical protein